MKINPSKPAHPLVRDYEPLVAFLGVLMGEHAEVVLHDLTCPDRSVVCIANGNLSGRPIGTPLTEYALRMLKGKARTADDFLYEYEGALKTGKQLRSATLFIKDANEELVGLLCLNMDMSGLHSLQKELDDAISTYFDFSEANASSYTSEPTKNYCPVNVPADSLASSPEHLASSSSAASQISPDVPVETRGEFMEHVMHSCITQALSYYHVPAARFSATERMEAVMRLQAMGFFQFKGAVEHAASTFGVSEATIYRDIKNIPKDVKEL